MARAKSTYSLTDSDGNRALGKIVRTDSCWEWSGGHYAAGYAIFNIKMADGIWRPTYGHRVIYELLVGPIPEGLELDHLCKNRGCVNPEHLEPVTHRINSLRSTSPMARQLAQTHCLNGHELSEWNVYRRPGRPNKRECRICMKRRETERVRIR